MRGPRLGRGYRAGTAEHAAWAVRQWLPGLSADRRIEDLRHLRGEQQGEGETHLIARLRERDAARNVDDGERLDSRDPYRSARTSMKR
jgi:hypothetical protein